MKPELRRVGKTQTPVVVIDEFSGRVEDIARLADAMAPFPPIQGNYYPGLRRIFGAEDTAAYAYAMRACQAAAPFIGGGFGVQGFDLFESSFSIVTTQPHELQSVQRTPHFDSPDQAVLAMLHYLRVPEDSGTAFYRHRSTGVERVTTTNVDWFAHMARLDAAKLPADSGYMHGSDDFYEQIGMVEAVPDRLVIYPSSLLHSGVVPPDMRFSADPREGRLTANFFLRGR